ncbi:hypothetical protein DAI22_09g107300 [Oryza sativa Japonica Group]|nr:hypothetical protein DAI22_09g107300 [Oryza sativa Japonica Group]
MTATPGRLPRPQGSSSAVPRPRGLPGVSVLLLPDKAMDAGEDMPPVAEEPTLRRSDKVRPPLRETLAYSRRPPSIHDFVALKCGG